MSSQKSSKVPPGGQSVAPRQCTLPPPSYKSHVPSAQSQVQPSSSRANVTALPPPSYKTLAPTALPPQGQSASRSQALSQKGNTSSKSPSIAKPSYLNNVPSSQLSSTPSNVVQKSGAPSSSKPAAGPLDGGKGKADLSMIPEETSRLPSKAAQAPYPSNNKGKQPVRSVKDIVNASLPPPSALRGTTTHQQPGQRKTIQKSVKFTPSTGGESTIKSSRPSSQLGISKLKGSLQPGLDVGNFSIHPANQGMSQAGTSKQQSAMPSRLPDGRSIAPKTIAPRKKTYYDEDDPSAYQPSVKSSQQAGALVPYKGGQTTGGSQMMSGGQDQSQAIVAHYQSVKSSLPDKLGKQIMVARYEPMRKNAIKPVLIKALAHIHNTDESEVTAWISQNLIMWDRLEDTYFLQALWQHLQVHPSKWEAQYEKLESFREEHDRQEMVMMARPDQAGGESSAQGAQGAQGVQGVQGAQGVLGAPGVAGVAGAGRVVVDGGPPVVLVHRPFFPLSAWGPRHLYGWGGWGGYGPYW